MSTVSIILSMNSSREYKILQQVLKQYRLSKGLTQLELAKQLGKPQSFISKYESGERDLDFVEIHRICKALGVSLIDFAKRYIAELETN